MRLILEGLADVGRGAGARRALVRFAMNAAKVRGAGKRVPVAIPGSRYCEQLGFEVIGAPPDRDAAKRSSYKTDARVKRAAHRPSRSRKELVRP